MTCTRVVTSFLAVCAVLVAFAPPAQARRTGGFGGSPGSKTFGIGLIGGAPSGLSAELRFGPRTGLDLALGLDAFEENDFYLHVDYLVYLVDLSRGGSVSVPIYLGFGGVLWDEREDNHNDDDDLRLGVRVPLGLAIALRGAPFQFFVEGALRILFVDERNGDHDRVDLTGAVGFRVYL